MADNRNRNVNGSLDPNLWATLEEIDVLLRADDLEPDDTAMSGFQEALNRLWAEEEAKPRDPARRAENTSALSELGLSRAKRRVPDNHFRPNLEGLGPREMSSFPVNPLGASLVGAASMAIMVPPNHHYAATPSLGELHAGSGPESMPESWRLRNDLGAPGEASLLDQIWTNGKPSFGNEDSMLAFGPQESPPIMPEWGAVLLLGGLRREREKREERRKSTYSPVFPGPSSLVPLFT
jgi:hypothetical protein